MKKRLHHPHLPAHPLRQEQRAGAFRLDDEAEAFAEEFIAEATSAEHVPQAGKEDAVAEETRDRYLRRVEENEAE